MSVCPHAKIVSFWLELHTVVFTELHVTVIVTIRRKHSDGSVFPARVCSSITRSSTVLATSSVAMPSHVRLALWLMFCGVHLLSQLWLENTCQFSQTPCDYSRHFRLFALCWCSVFCYELCYFSFSGPKQWRAFSAARVQLVLFIIRTIITSFSPYIRSF